MNENLTQIGRIAFRHEGDWWNAYYALPTTMDRTIHLGSVKFTAITRSQKVKEMFVATMREIVCDIFEENFGIRPDWTGLTAAPEHEKAGHS